jgi:hypothetical protein
MRFRKCLPCQLPAEFDAQDFLMPVREVAYPAEQIFANLLARFFRAAGPVGSVT